MIRLAPILALALLLAYVASASIEGASMDGVRLNVYTQPNIVVVIVDDVAPGDLSSPFTLTPKLDTLAQAGVKLSSLTVYAVCAPTRAALLSGMHAPDVGVTGPFGTNFDERTILNEMTDLGYRTAVIGKGGLGLETYTTHKWSDWGAEIYDGFLSPDVADSYSWNNVYREATAAGVWISNSEATNTTYTADAFTDKAIAAWDKHKTDTPGSPVFMVVSYSQPAHVPLDAPPGDPCTGSDCYDAQITHWDLELQDLVDHTGLENTTYIVFSDNGKALGAGVCKGTWYECGITMGATFFGAHVEDLADITALADIHDLYPTIRQLGGYRLGDKTDRGCSLMSQVDPNWDWSSTCTKGYRYSYVGTDHVVSDDLVYKLIRDNLTGVESLFHIPTGEAIGDDLCSGGCPAGLTDPSAAYTKWETLSGTLTTAGH